MFGASHRSISLRAERSTHIRCLQGWEDRICTMIPFFLMTGRLVSPVVLIFKGQGKKVTQAELQVYSQLPDVLVLWQKKAWIDRYLERQVIEKQVVPLVSQTKKAYEEQGKVFPGFLLLEDRGPGHDDESVSVSFPATLIFLSDVLALSKENCIDIVLTPSDTTWAIQLVDDGRGKALRNLMYDEFDAYLEDFDWEKNPRGALSAMEKRVLTAKIMQRVYTKFTTSAEQTQHTINAAIRTGGRMEIEANYDNIQPVRFPQGFGSSILPNHPLSTLIKPYFPLTGTKSAPQLSGASAIGGSAIIQDGTVVVTGGSGSITLQGGPITVTGGSVTIQGGTITTTGGNISIEGISGLARPQSRPKGPSVAVVDMMDGYENNARIYEANEVESSEDSSIDDLDDAESRWMEHARKRRPRGCLPGCDCERKRGRLCYCEKSGDGICGDQCTCNKELCRTLANNSESDSDD